MDHPRIAVTGFEAEHGFRYSYDTIRFLKQACEGTRFVWIMGADNLRGFERWERWREIADLMPLAVYARPGANLRATFSKETLADREPPAWVYLHGMMSGQSSTAIRARRGLPSN